MSAGKKSLSRRHLLTIAGGAAGLAASSNALATVLTKPKADRAQRRPGKGVNAVYRDTPPEGVEPLGGVDGPGETKVGSDFGGPRFLGVQAKGGFDGEGRPLAMPPRTGSSFNGVPLETYAPPMPAPKGPVLRELAVPEAPAPVMALFGGIQPGARVGSCQVVSIHDIHMGAVPVVMATADGHRFQVDVLRRDAGGKSPSGIANTREFSLYLSNRGSGDSKTREEAGLGVMALAAALAANEAKAPKALLTLKQRNARFPRGGFALPV